MDIYGKVEALDDFERALKNVSKNLGYIPAYQIDRYDNGDYILVYFVEDHEMLIGKRLCMSMERIYGKNEFELECLINSYL